jgi:hypothetical protein
VTPHRLGVGASFIELRPGKCWTISARDMSGVNLGPIHRFDEGLLSDIRSAEQLLLTLCQRSTVENWMELFGFLLPSKNHSRRLADNILEEVNALMSERGLSETLRVVINKKGQLLHIAPTLQDVQSVNKSSMTIDHKAWIRIVLSEEEGNKVLCSLVSRGFFPSLGFLQLSSASTPNQILSALSVLMLKTNFFSSATVGIAVRDISFVVLFLGIGFELQKKNQYQSLSALPYQVSVRSNPRVWNLTFLASL